MNSGFRVERPPLTKYYVFEIINQINLFIVLEILKNIYFYTVCLTKYYVFKQNITFLNKILRF
jgi:hypothetical protein